MDHWISREYGRLIESVDSDSVNVSVYNPLAGCSYIQLPKELRNSMKGLINMKNYDKFC